MTQFNITPFASNMDYEYVKIDEIKRYCSVEWVKRLFEKHKLDDIDMQIMNILFEYKLLNYDRLETALNYEVTLTNKVIDLQSNITKLRKVGVLGMYRTQENKQAFYMLSDGAAIFCSLQQGRKMKRTMEYFSVYIECNSVNHILSINSAMISLQKYRKIKCYPRRDDNIRYFTIDLGWIKANFATTSIRRGDDVENVVRELDCRASCFYQKNIYYMLVLEDYKHILEVSKIINKLNFYNREQIFYTTDREAKVNPLNGLYLSNEDFESVKKVSII